MNKELITSTAIDSIISAYNSIFHANKQYKTESTRARVSVCLELAENTSELQTFILMKYQQNPNCSLETALDDFQCWVMGGRKDMTPAAHAPVVNTPAPTASTPTLTDDDRSMLNAMRLIGSVVADKMGSMDTEKMQEDIVAKGVEALEEYIKKTYGPLKRKVEVDVDVNGAKAQLKQMPHKRFADVLKLVCKGNAVYLVGPAGCGKNVLCEQLAEALHLEFYFTNCVTQEYQLKGFTDAMGNYQPSTMYQWLTNGGVFLLDEMDASIPETLTILNSLLANGYIDFPAPIGRVKKHPNCRLVAAGNTAGHGADYDYVSRNQLDAASMDRFNYIFMDYDPKIEEAVTQGDRELLGFCRAFRKATKKAGIRAVVSYRGMKTMAEMKDLLETKDLIQACLTKALEKSDLECLRSDMSGWGKYSEAFEALCR